MSKIVSIWICDQNRGINFVLLASNNNPNICYTHYARVMCICRKFWRNVFYGPKIRCIRMCMYCDCHVKLINKWTLSLLNRRLRCCGVVYSSISHKKHIQHTIGLWKFTESNNGAACIEIVDTLQICIRNTCYKIWRYNYKNKYVIQNFK